MPSEAHVFITVDCGWHTPSGNIHIYEEEERKYDEANDTKWKHLVTLGKEFFVFLKLNL